MSEQGISKAIHAVFANGQEQSQESYSILLTLIRLLANSRILIGDLIESGVMLDCINIA